MAASSARCASSMQVQARRPQITSSASSRAKDLIRQFGAELSDGGAGVRLERNEAVGLKLAHGLAHGNLADAQPRRDLVDHQPLAGLVFAVNDRVAQHVVHDCRLAAKNRAHPPCLRDDLKDRKPIKTGFVRLALLAGRATEHAPVCENLALDNRGEIIYPIRYSIHDSFGFG
jgi:hypothetical protein